MIRIKCITINVSFLFCSYFDYDPNGFIFQIEMISVDVITPGDNKDGATLKERIKRTTRKNFPVI